MAFFMHYVRRKLIYREVLRQFIASILALFYNAGRSLAAYGRVHAIRLNTVEICVRHYSRFPINMTDDGAR
jgi:hypothetical protein